jgi:hypothetical protein
MTPSWNPKRMGVPKSNESGALDVFLMLFVQIDFLRTPWSAVSAQNILKILALTRRSPGSCQVQAIQPNPWRRTRGSGSGWNGKDQHST